MSNALCIAKLAPEQAATRCRTTPSRLLAAAAALTIAACLLPTAASAQQATPSQAPETAPATALPSANTAPATDTSTTSPAASTPGDIVVTATRRAQNLQQVPIAVTAVSEAQLRVANIADTRDLGKLVPALQFVQGSTTKLVYFSVRGVGTYISSDSFDQSVAIAFDGVPLARPGGSIADLVDLDHVEVLEGPQGMLFGKNASAGLVNIVSNSPKLGVTQGEARLSYGSYNELQTTATLNVPLASNVAVRASAWRFAHDGFADQINTGRELGRKNSYGGRLRLRWDPDNKTKINISGEWTGAHQDPAILTIRSFATNTYNVQAYEQAAGIVAGPDNLRLTSTANVYNRSDSQAYTAQIDREIGSATLTSVTSWRDIGVAEQYDPDATDAPLVNQISADDVRYKQFSQELRVTSGANQRLRYVAGLIYFRLNLYDKFNTSLFGIQPYELSINAYTNLLEQHYAAFGELTFDVTKRLRAIAGGRISRDTVSGSFDREYRDPPTTIVASVNGPGTAYGPFQASSDTSATEPSYRFGLQYDIGSRFMAYATISRGYKGPGLDFTFNVTQTVFNTDQLRVEPEISHNIEVGLRSQFFDKLLTINLTAFHERFSNFQASVRLPTVTPVFATLNAGEIKSDGIEGNFAAGPFSGFSLSGSSALIHARYTDFSNAPCYPREPTAAAGTPLTPGICVSSIQTLNGHALANSPRFTLNLTARYDGRIGGAYPFFLQAGYRYQSHVFFNSAADPYEQQNGYSIVTLAAGVRTADERFGLSLYVKNLADRNFVSRTVSNFSGAYYSQTLSYDARRTIGFALDAKF